MVLSWIEYDGIFIVVSALDGIMDNDHKIAASVSTTLAIRDTRIDTKGLLSLLQKVAARHYSVGVGVYILR